MSETSGTDDSNMVFGAGFAFGAAATMLVITGIIASGSAGVGSQGVITSVAGALFAGIIGAALYMLSFQENRDKLPFDMEGGDDAATPTDE